LRQGNDHRVVAGADRQQVLLAVFKIAFERGEAVF
jgi:hypothetical protein